MKTLSIVGAGKLATTLAYLWHQQGTFHIGQVLCRQYDHAIAACHFIGAGQAVTTAQSLQPSDLWLIATPDRSLVEAAAQLTTLLRADDVIFHCSGACSSQLLPDTPAARASVHPVHSFALPQHSVNAFRGTYCTAEGDPAALNLLQPAFEAIGGQFLVIDSASKALYHASTVMACNYLVTLMDASLACLEHAGISLKQGRALLQPLAEQTLRNGFNHDSAEVLTGPIARRDAQTVSQHLQSLVPHPDLHDLYRTLGQHTLPIAARQSHPDSLQTLQQLLNDATDRPQS